MTGEILVTKHAIERFRERTKSLKTDREISYRIRKMFERARPIELPAVHRVIKIIENNMRPVKYFRGDSGFVFITSEDKQTIITVYQAKEDKWGCKQ